MSSPSSTACSYKLKVLLYLGKQVRASTQLEAQTHLHRPVITLTVGVGHRLAQGAELVATRRQVVVGITGVSNQASLDSVALVTLETLAS